ncbi:enoyl-CoA hydratase-related protein [Marinobacter zhanjiangensis]|uniref:Gamma-carboxygeranoyl-CoA hydratase n=1 Tax=Marinobacter zhanjiangensis TaxID=578215 RepID=A0ABQ3ATS2_9GAMM|nr:enoyl-CoA hydratase-related protein [Marinobacter zhanjiangensis]GGY67044.1 gamma-carboxygeranoyl-CoA hydratase [Marinobacter zhanjiangensis]
MTETAIISTTDSRGVTRIALNRPDKRNAFDDRIITELTDAIQAARSNPDCRVVVLAGEGRHFSAGADLNYMKRTAELSEQENIDDARRLANLMQTLDRLDRPTLCLVQGAAYGGALGLICASDIAIGTENSQFCLSEARLGITPAAIGPYVVRTLGQRHARRYFQTAEVIRSDRALELGLIHERVADDALDARAEELIAALLRNGPTAMAAGKQLITGISGGAISDEMIQYTAEVIARLRTGDEGQEGLAAFFDKRTPDWAVTS